MIAGGFWTGGGGDEEAPEVEGVRDWRKSFGSEDARPSGEYGMKASTLSSTVVTNRGKYT